MEQLGSGHSRSTGEGGGLPTEAGGVGTLATRDFFPGVAGGASSSPVRLFRFELGSGRGGMNGVGDDVPVAAVATVVALFAGPDAPPRLPFPPPFRNLLCTDDLVSVKLLKSFPGVAFAAARPRFPRPFGVRASKSLVGESQNLGGAQSCRVQSNNVPT